MAKSMKFINNSGAEIVLGNAAPYLLQKIDIKTGVEISNSKGVKQDGRTYLGNTLEEMDISLQIAVIGEGKEDIENKKRLLQRAFNPKNDEGVLQYDNGIKAVESKCIVNELPYFASQNIRMARCLISLTAHQPFWNELFQESEEMSYIMGGLRFNLALPAAFSSRGFKRKAINGGDVETPVEIEFKGPAVNPTVTNVTTGEFIRVKRELGEDDILTIYTGFGEKYVNINGENAFSYIDLESSFWQMEPGENILSYQSNNDSIKTRVKVKWKNRYIGE
ncbi:Phage tail protein [Peptoclostridium litorale DSM 5388]|uniref:Phage protein n=1 Tax=Peptoclostridium litorale DSM 5388 TaxID=1121324 RepID=A0A069RGF9_PEPLI|nr:phage tail domain-containing protein [Peptoclostridium litorale]KDR95898.1 phage protein [Peptoclostridium litorale DSM 5388]SIO10422.1 Phage tail protein [Peptoclostridium litorale DSM 5388]